MKLKPTLLERDVAADGMTDAGGRFSKSQIEAFRCTSAGNPARPHDGYAQDAMVREALRKEPPG